MKTTTYQIKTSIAKNNLILPNGTSSVRSLKKLVNQGFHSGDLIQYDGKTDKYIMKNEGIYFKYAGQKFKKFKLKIIEDEVYILVERFNSPIFQTVGKIPKKDKDFFQMALKHCSSYVGEATITGGAKKVSKDGYFITYQSGEYGIDLDITFYFKTELEDYGFLLPKKIPEIIPEEVTDYIALDLELISGEYLFTEIIEIGAIKYIDGVELERFQTYVKPKQRIPYITRKLTNIDDELVKDADPIEVVLPNLLRFIGDLPILGHDVLNNDMRIIKKEMYRMNIGFLSNPAIDTLKLSKLTYNFDHYRLSDIKDNLGIKIRSHEAVNDCIVSNRIFQDYKELMQRTKDENET